MFRNILDAVLDYKAAHVVNMVAQLAALAWAVGLRKGIGPILAVNIIIAGVVILYNVPQVPNAFRSEDYRLLGLILFEIAALATAIATLSGIPIPAWLSWVAFAVNFLLCAALTLFALAFKMTRLM